MSVKSSWLFRHARWILRVTIGAVGLFGGGVRLLRGEFCAHRLQPGVVDGPARYTVGRDRRRRGRRDAHRVPSRSGHDGGGLPRPGRLRLCRPEPLVAREHPARRQHLRARTVASNISQRDVAFSGDSRHLVFRDIDDCGRAPCKSPTPTAERAAGGPEGLHPQGQGRRGGLRRRWRRPILPPRSRAARRFQCGRKTRVTGPIRGSTRPGPLRRQDRRHRRLRRRAGLAGRGPAGLGPPARRGRRNQGGRRWNFHWSRRGGWLGSRIIRSGSIDMLSLALVAADGTSRTEVSASCHGRMVAFAP